MNKNLKIFITGSKGQLGYDCIRVLKEKGYSNILGTDIDTLDITDEDAVNKIILDYRPDIIFHNAAYTAVDKAEQNIDLVYKVNSDAPFYIAKAAKKIGAKMFFISTDYVFDGVGTTPFEIDSPKKGLSIYGKSKSLGEDNVIKTFDKYFILRISWLFGINGNNFVKSMINLAKLVKKELNIVNDQIGSPTYSLDLAKLMVEMMETDKYGIYHVTNEGFTSWADFAINIFNECNLDVKVKKVSTDEYLKINPNQARRPLNSRLSKKSLVNNGFSLLPPWQDALKRYIHQELKM